MPEILHIPANDILIAYRDLGPAQPRKSHPTPLLMITGYGGLMEMWPPGLIEALANARRLVLFDNRGMGHTSSSSRQYSIELFAEDAKALLDALDIEQAHVLGWSMGAFIAQELALKHKTRVDRLILLAGSCGGDEAVWPSEETWQTLTDLSGTLEERIQRMLSNLFPQAWLQENPDPSAYFPRITAPIKDENLLRQSLTLKSWPGACARLEKLAANTLIMTGSEDRVIPHENADMLAERIPRATVVRIPEGGHGFFFQVPDFTASVVNRFLGEEEHHSKTTLE